MHNLAVVYQNMGRFNDALPLYIECLALNEEVLGKKHTDTLSTVGDLATLYENMRLYYDAIPLYKNVWL